MAQYFTDFSEYTTNQEPNDWTQIQGPNDFTVQEVTGAEGGKVLDITTTARNIIQWDAIPDTQDIEVVAKYRTSAQPDEEGPLVVARLDDVDNWVAGSTGFVPFAPAGDSLQLAVNSGGSVVVDHVPFSASANTWYWIRLQVTGTDDKKLKIWEDGTAEPAWMIESAFGAPETGGAGLGGDLFADGNDYEFDVFGVGTDGDPAPTESIEEPLDGSISASSAIVGDIAVDKFIASAIAAESDITGDMKNIVPISGGIDSASSIAGEIDLTVGLIGTIQAQSELIHEELIQRLAGQITGQSEIVGGTDVRFVLKSNITSASTLQADPPVLDMVLSGRFSSHSQVSAVLKRKRPLQGTITGESSLSGDARTSREFPIDVNVALRRSEDFPIEAKVSVDGVISEFPIIAFVALPRERQIHARLFIERPDTGFIRVDDFLVSCELIVGDVNSVGTESGGADNVVRQLSFVLQQEGADRFNPRDQNSPWNNLGVGFNPLIWPNRQVILDLQETAAGIDPVPANWVRMFVGLLGDRIETDGPRVRVQCRDLAKRLQDAFIFEERIYGSEGGTPAQEVIQNIIDDELGSGVVTLRVADNPGFMVLPYRVEYKSVWDAIQQVVNQFGWFLGYRWWGPTGSFELVLMEPPRDKTTADFQYNWEDEVFVRSLDITDRDIRNSVKVIYRDAATDLPASVTVTDASSINEFGLRRMQIEEGDSLLITNAAQATALGQAAVDDLSQMTGEFNVTLAFQIFLDVFSSFSLFDPKMSTSTDLYAVESVSHSLNWDTGVMRTSALCSTRVIGGHRRWLDMEARPGASPPIETGEIGRSRIDTDRVIPRAITAEEALQVVDDLGTATDALFEWVTIPGFELDFDLREETDVLIWMSVHWGLDVFGTDGVDTGFGAGGLVLAVDDSRLLETMHRYQVLHRFTDLGAYTTEAGYSVHIALTLPAGAHTIEGQFTLEEGQSFWVFSRILGILELKR